MTGAAMHMAQTAPRSEAELAEAIAAADRPVTITGGGTRGLATQGTRLSVAAISGISLYEPGALTIVAQAGTPLAEVQQALTDEGQRLAFEPPDLRALLGTTGTPTIGGTVATNASGPRRIAVGAARDFLLGIRYVDGMGTVVKNGGRVMKNVTGYDLVKLMCGAYGTLGVLSEVSLKVLPVAETQASVRLDGLDDVAAVAAMNRAMGSPYEVTGAAHDPAAGATWLRLEGFEASVRYRGDALRALLGAGEVIAGEQSAAIWQGLRDVAPFHDQPGDVWRVSVRPSDGPGIVARAGAEAAFYDWSGGLIWLRTASGYDLRAALGQFAGHATLIRADARTRAAQCMFHPEPAPVAAISRGLRARFDPRGILNPGLMAPT